MKKTTLILFLLTFILNSGTLMAQNLLANGEFDTDLSGWFAYSAITWVSNDGAPLSGNGSMMNTNGFNNGGSFPAVSDKFAVDPNYWYLTSVSYKVPSASPVPWVWYMIFWYDDMNNQIGTSNQVAPEYYVEKDVWKYLADISQAPDNAAMGEMRIYFQAASAEEPDLPFGLWDDVIVLEETIFMNGFN